MAYDIDKILCSGINVVFATAEQDRQDIQQQILKLHPEYEVKLSDKFFNKKIGPLTIKAKNTMLEILMQESVLKRKGESYVMDHLKALNSEFLIHRKPQALSYGQKVTFQLVMDVANGKTSFLLNDGEVILTEQLLKYNTGIVKWLLSLKEFNNHGSLILLTKVSVDEYLNYIFENDLAFSPDFKFFSIENGQLVSDTTVFVKHQIYILNKTAEARALREKAKKAESEKDYAAAYQYYLEFYHHKFAEDYWKGEVCIALAELYEHGNGVEKNFKEAANWYTKALKYIEPESPLYKEIKNNIRLYSLSDFEERFQKEKDKLSKYYTESFSEESINRFVKQTILAKLDTIEIQKLMQQGR